MSVIKGAIGEYIVEDILNKFKSSDVKYIHNMILPKSNGSVTQIDFVILTPSSFIALEVKNWDCVVIVNDNSSWELRYPSGKVIRNNPESQNKSHIKVLSEHSNYEYENKIFFTDKTKIVGSNPIIINGLGLYALLRDSTRKYTKSEIQDEYHRLLKIKYDNYNRWLIKSSNYCNISVDEDLIDLFNKVVNDNDKM